MIREVYRDLLQVPMLGCDGFECHGDPYAVQYSAAENYIFEFCRFRKVDRTRAYICKFKFKEIDTPVEKKDEAHHPVRP